MNKIKEIYDIYKSYIFIAIIIILIIIIGFLYSYKVTEEEEINITESVKEDKNEKEEEKYKVDIKGEVKHPGVYELYNDDRVIDVIKKADGLTLDADTSYINLSKKLTDEMVIIIYSKDEIKEYRKKQKEIKNNNEIKKSIEKYDEVKEEFVCPNITNNACIEEKNISNNNNLNESVKSKKEDNNDKNETVINEKPKINEEQVDDTINLNKININKASKEELLILPGIGESKADRIIEYRNEQLFNSIDDIKNIRLILKEK